MRNSRKISANANSPSWCTRMSTYVCSVKKSCEALGTCVPPNTIKQFGCAALIFFANALLYSQFQRYDEKQAIAGSFLFLIILSGLVRKKSGLWKRKLSFISGNI